MTSQFKSLSIVETLRIRGILQQVVDELLGLQGMIIEMTGRANCGGFEDASIACWGQRDPCARTILTDEIKAAQQRLDYVGKIVATMESREDD